MVIYFSCVILRLKDSVMPQQIILIRGLSGSGKTSLANIIVGDDENRTAVSVDDYFTDDAGYSFDPNKLKEAHTWCKEEVERCLKDGFEVVCVHNTFSRKWECDPYIELARENGYELHVLNLYDAGLNDQQLAERNVHGVPSHIIQSQRKRWDKDVYRERKAPAPHHQAPFNGGYPPPYGYGQPPYGYAPPQYGYAPQGDFGRKPPRHPSR